MDVGSILSSIAHMSIGELIIAGIIVIVTAWLYLDPEHRTKFFLSNPSMAITLWSIAVLLSGTWYAFEPLHQFAIVFVALPWLIMCTFAYGFRLYFYILNRMIEEYRKGKVDRGRQKVSWRNFLK